MSRASKPSDIAAPRGPAVSFAMSSSKPWQPSSYLLELLAKRAVDVTLRTNGGSARKITIESPGQVWWRSSLWEINNCMMPHNRNLNRI
jgi:hypothetical protein